MPRSNKLLTECVKLCRICKSEKISVEHLHKCEEIGYVEQTRKQLLDKNGKGINWMTKIWKKEHIYKNKEELQ